jgi:hypothetical protein
MQMLEEFKQLDKEKKTPDVKISALQSIAKEDFEFCEKAKKTKPYSTVEERMFKLQLGMKVEDREEKIDQDNDLKVKEYFEKYHLTAAELGT